jgi:hypothetical protein
MNTNLYHTQLVGVKRVNKKVEMSPSDLLMSFIGVFFAWEGSTSKRTLVIIILRAATSLNNRQPNRASNTLLRKVSAASINNGDNILCAYSFFNQSRCSIVPRETSSLADSNDPRHFESSLMKISS